MYDNTTLKDIQMKLKWYLTFKKILISHHNINYSLILIISNQCAILMYCTQYVYDSF